MSIKTLRQVNIVKYSDQIVQKSTTLLIILVMLLQSPVQAKQYSLPEKGNRLIGKPLLYTVKPGDYFHAIATRHNIGLIALLEANPLVDPFLPTVGTLLQIPNQMLLPDTDHQGIVINLAELRLYFFEKSSEKVHVFPIGIGRVDSPTPVMNSRIISKIKDPNWTPNARIRAEFLEKKGKKLPKLVPAGKDNPLGKWAIQLDYGNKDYLIHGTNQNFGIGMRVSSGCIRMNPENISWLIKKVSINDSVTIINQPIKTSTEVDGSNYLEVHSPLSIELVAKPNNLLWVGEKVKFKNRNKVDNKRVNEALLQQQGIAINVDI